MLDGIGIPCHFFLKTGYHLLWLYRRKISKKCLVLFSLLLAASMDSGRLAEWNGSFWICQLIQTQVKFCQDRLTWCFAETRPMRGQVIFRGSINSTQQWRLACIALQQCFVALTSLSLLIFVERSMAENFCCPCFPWSFLLIRANSAEAWLFLLGPTTTADMFALLTLSKWTTGIRQLEIEITSTKLLLNNI